MVTITRRELTEEDKKEINGRIFGMRLPKKEAKPSPKAKKEQSTSSKLLLIPLSLSPEEALKSVKRFLKAEKKEINSL